jgi:hypothetical protein
VCNHPFLCNGLEEDYTDKKRMAVEKAAAAAAAADVSLAEAGAVPAIPSPLVGRCNSNPTTSCRAPQAS